MTVVLDWKTADFTVPDPPARCTMCGDNLEPPFVHYWCPWEDETVHILICAGCGNKNRRGLMADLARMDAIREPLNPPPDCPTLQTVQ